MSRSRMVNDPAARAEARARSVPVLSKFIHALLDEYGPEHNELPIVVARRYLASSAGPWWRAMSTISRKARPRCAPASPSATRIASPGWTSSGISSSAMGVAWC